MIYFSAVGMVNALGSNLDQISNNLANNHSGIVERHNWLQYQASTMVGEVQMELPSVPYNIPQHHSRNNQLLLAALAQIQVEVDQAIIDYGRQRIAVIMGSSTSGIYEGEKAIAEQLATGKLPEHYHYQQQELGDPSTFLAAYLSLSGPAYTLSTACSSSARAIISGQRLIQAGLVDAAIVGGADSLCKMAIGGFNSLASLSDRLCTPFATERCGINIGEGASLILLSHKPSSVALLGTGESSDAWHMSAPHPKGIGAEQAMRMALKQADVTPKEVGYVNLHGTATLLNDQMEALAVSRVLGKQVPGSSTKHLTGHTLGAAGAIEAALCWLMLSRNLPLPPQDFSVATRDNSLAEINLLTEAQKPRLRRFLSNSFAFGGNNASLLLGDIALGDTP